MKKALLSMAVMCLTLAASAGDGLTLVGANVAVAPSSRWSGDQPWSAKTWVYFSNARYPAGGVDAEVYNELCGIPAADAQGREWYEVEYSLEPKEEDLNWDVRDAEDNPTQIVWEEHEAPFSSDANYNGRPSYQWTLGDIRADIYFRRTFTTDQLLSGDVWLACGHDDAPAEYYLNGELIFQVTGFELWNPEDPNSGIKNGWNDQEYIKLTDEQKALIKLGGEENLLAVHVHQNWGGALADCGLYTKIEGGLEMGYSQPWTAKVLFNSWGGYNFDGSNNESKQHPWEKLYEAQEGDVYTIHLEGACQDQWGEQVHFKTPIRVLADHSYTFACKLAANKDFKSVTVKLCGNDDDETVLAQEIYPISADDDTEVELPLQLENDLQNVKVVFDFAQGEADADVVIKEMSLMDDIEDEEIWVGTHYFNYFYVTQQKVTEIKDEETGEVIDYDYEQVQVNAPAITGRVETLAWTLPEFDDSMWAEQAMPMGNEGYMPEQQSIWYGNMNHKDYTGSGVEGENTNYWIRRNFTLDKVNERLSYALNVLHDDSYQTYVNGHLLQAYSGWTDGKNPKQVHIPSKYLREGKNVIATYIQQNWGGRFYDCGINVVEVNYEQCAQDMKNALAAAEEKATLPLTTTQKENLAKLIENAKNELETNKDAAEIKEAARALNEAIQPYQSYSDAYVLAIQTLNFVKKENKGYCDDIIASCETELEACATNGETNKYLDQLRLYRMINARERRTENFVGTEKPEAGVVGDDYAQTYYIYNVGEKQFLGGGDSWGCHCVVGHDAIPFALINTIRVDVDGEPTQVPIEKENTYRIESFRANGEVGVADFIAYNSYIDCNTNDAWTLVPVEGKANVFNIVRADDNNLMLGYSGYGDNDRASGYGDGFKGVHRWIVDSDLHTGSLPSNQWMFITKEELNSFAAKATAEAPADLTHLITSPGFDQRVWDRDWMSSYSKYINDNGNEDGGVGIWGRGDDHWDFVFECWNAGEYDLNTYVIDEAEIMQPGWYEVACQGYYREGSFANFLDKVNNGDPICDRAELYATTDGENEVAVNLVSIAKGINQVPGWGNERHGMRMPDACWEAAERFFWNGLYWNKLMIHLSAEDLKNGLILGVRKPHMPNKEDNTVGEWVVVDNFRLRYYGESEKEPTGIGSIAEESNTGMSDNTIYNLLGQKLTRLQKGVNIINGRKVVIK